MENLNQVQRYLLSFGYPMSVVREYRTKSEFYRKEVKQYGKDKAIQSNCEKH
jgi:hypothetical protein